MNAPKPVLSPEPFTHSTALWRPSFLETCGWCVLALLVALGTLARFGTPGFGNDSYQYLSAADNIRAGKGIATSVIFFDAERAHGVIPAPLTTFPPGYPILIAAVSMIVVRPVVAAVGISVLSFVLLPFVLRLAAPIGIRPWPFRSAVLLVIGNSQLLACATSVATEALFTFVAAAVIACFCRALVARKGSEAPWLISGWALAGLSYWIRYAGLFVIVGALVFFGVQFALQRSGRTSRHLAAAILALAAVAANMARNVMVSGSWKGGVAKQGSHLVPAGLRDLWAAIRDVVLGVYHVVLGGFVAVRVGFGEVLLGAGLLVLLWLAIRARTRSAERKSLLRLMKLIVGMMAVYCVAVAAANLTMVVSSGARYFVPLVPLIGLLAVVWFSTFDVGSRGRTFRIASGALIVAGYLSIHARHWVAYTPPAPHQEIVKAFAEPIAGGGDLSTWFHSNVAPAEVVTASNGQATAYVLHRPNLCLADPPYSTMVWTESAVFREMNRFKSSYLVLYTHLPAGFSPDQEESPFLRDLLYGKVPDWLYVAAQNGSVIVFRRNRRASE